ncbi:MAG: hypothetical protein HDT18_10365 [Oscillibacter sp.]|nr:hypothetical protein [Oscillibacter sp.]
MEKKNHQNEAVYTIYGHASRKFCTSRGQRKPSAGVISPSVDGVFV